MGTRAEEMPGQVLDWDDSAVTVIGDSDEDVRVVRIVTVLKAGQAGDIAAYRAGLALDRPRTDADLLRIARHGQKLRYEDAKKIWPGIDSYGTYRR